MARKEKGTRHTEVEAYNFIKEKLREAGWVVKDPSRNTGGQVWTQNQCLAHPEIKLALGAARPENIVKIMHDKLWIIEAKAERNRIEAAISEATHGYAGKINDVGGTFQAILATGVAGSDASGYTVETKVLVGGKWQPVTINGQKSTGFLTPKDAQALVTVGGSNISDFAPPQHLFLLAAERINGILHIGGINRNDRAKTMAALLLAVIEGTPNLDTSLPVLIGEINTRSEAVLRKNDKSDFAPHVKIIPPTNRDNHVKYRNALVHTIQELQNLNVRSAMNSSTDVLGQFYEVFLKYGNGAKEIGIVLTPRHVTQFAVEAISVSDKDVVLDPACGTGGFLVAALDHVRRNANARQFERFKRHNIFGVEQDVCVALLAVVNMIFRGDGKHNLIEGNCFSTFLEPQVIGGHPSAVFVKEETRVSTELVVTRVLMNPPFALQSSEEKEYKFVTHALSLMSDGGILFSLLPMGVMFGANEEKIWRERDLLSRHTLLGVLSFPSELFYPAALKQVVAIIVKKGTPHPKPQSVFWGRIARDGHVKVKSKRLCASDLQPPRVEPNDLDTILPILRGFLAQPSKFQVNTPMLCKTAPINFSDPLLELLPEVYLDSPIPSAEELRCAISDMTREMAAFLVRFGREGLAGDYDETD